MVRSIANSICAMFWAFVLFAILLYIAALLFVQLIRGYLTENIQTIDDKTRFLMFHYFGSVETGILTLYQSASGGIDWEVVYVTVEESGPISAIVFIFFIWLFNFALVNVMCSIVIQHALAVGLPDREELALQQRRQEESDAANLRELIIAMEHKSHGMITLDEFLVQAHAPYASAYLKTLGISIDDASTLFNILHRSIGSAEGLPIDEFVTKLVKMKGDAKSIDVQSLAFEVSVIRHTLNAIAGALSLDKVPESHSPMFSGA